MGTAILTARKAASAIALAPAGASRQPAVGERRWTACLPDASRRLCNWTRPRSKSGKKSS